MNMLCLSMHHTLFAFWMWDRIAKKGSSKCRLMKTNHFSSIIVGKLLEHSEKWRFSNQEAPPKKIAFVALDADEHSDEPNGGTNTGKLDVKERVGEEEGRTRKLKSKK